MILMINKLSHSESLEFFQIFVLSHFIRTGYLANWAPYIRGFKAYLQLEKALAAHSVEAYIRDVDKLTQYLDIISLDIGPEKVTHRLLQDFLKWIAELGLTSRSQSRLISGLRGFFRYQL